MHIFLSTLYRVIRHQAVGLGEGPYDAKDKFRIDIYSDKRVIGRKLVVSTLVREPLKVTHLVTHH